ncbi:hypothetical protein [Streptomyces agglomeratus]|uniref:hypothetical protein n=1 Tax=Streptomyces agglomeratus TaxID=285458 RepID=UPI0008544ACF|nr:hypothetical protein [Streptomyces agglomeratus]OEJ36520.1 hypothetical protein BGK72_38120 [Streptomyces agglomeratus]
MSRIRDTSTCAPTSPNAGAAAHLARPDHQRRPRRANDVYRLPADQDGEAVRAAWERIYDALPKALIDERHALRTGKEVVGGNRVFGPDGYEHTPLYAAPIDRADVEVLAALLGHFRRALAREEGYTDLRSLLADAGEWYGEESGERVPESAEQVVDRLARAVAVLQLDDDDTRTLLDAVTGAGPDGRIELALGQEPAARRYFDRVITAVTEGKAPIERALARFVEFGDDRPAAT